MNKIIKIAFTVSIFGIGLTALASTGVSCNVNDHPVWNDGNTAIVACLDNAAWQKAAAESMARQANNLLVITPGTVVSNGKGGIDFCPKFYDRTNCWVTDGEYHFDPMAYGAVKQYFPEVR